MIFFCKNLTYKTRLATNIDGYPLRLASLFEQAYSDGADLILSYWSGF